jgi:hypothetical protein
MENLTLADLAEAAFLEGDGEEMAALAMHSIEALAERTGVPVKLLPGHGVGILLAAAWNYAKTIDDNNDGGRAARYVELVRSHADTAERLG